MFMGKVMFLFILYLFFFMNASYVDVVWPKDILRLPLIASETAEETTVKAVDGKDEMLDLLARLESAVKRI